MAQIIDIPFDLEVTEHVEETRTYCMDFQNKRIRGFCNDKRAVMQAIWKILQTCRFAHLIYDDQYGCDIWNKVGKINLTQEYLDADIPEMLKDALCADDRINDVTDVTYTIVQPDSVYVTCVAHTIYGQITVEEVISDGTKYRGSQSR